MSWVSILPNLRRGPSTLSTDMNKDLCIPCYDPVAASDVPFSVHY